MKLIKVAKKVENKKKIILLNSGGFDSVCLAHELKYQIEPEAEIHSIFFKYGQKSESQEEECAHNICDKLGFHEEKFNIQFDWGNNALTGDTDNQYVPMRNLVFLSYALSYAERIGADKIYCAFILASEDYYKDASPQFVERINTIAENIGVEVVAPFIYDTKEDLLKAIARDYNILQSEFHSCNLSNESCGECSDCKAIESIYEDIDKKVADDILIDSQFNTQLGGFLKAIKDSKVTSMKLYINNGCQFKCKHCFIGNQILSDVLLSVEDWRDIIKQAKEYGVKHIDFFGKEPLLDDKIFSLLKECEGMTTSLITNGVNVPKFINELAESGVSVTMSVDSVKKKGIYRDDSSYILDNFTLLDKYGVTTSASIDVSRYNVSDIENIIRKVAKCGVQEFYVKPVRPFGAFENEMMKDLIDEQELIDLVSVLDKCKNKYGVEITYSLAMMDIHRMYAKYPKEFEEVFGGIIMGRRDSTKSGVRVDFELYCHRAKDSVAITPDGYMIGCASEFCTQYTNKGVDLRENDFSSAIDILKGNLTLNDYKNIGCYFCKEYRKNNAKIFENC